MISVDEYRQKSISELKNLAEDVRRSLVQVRLTHAQGDVSDYSKIRKLKKDLARILTIKKQKEILEE